MNYSVFSLRAEPVLPRSIRPYARPSEPSRSLASRTTDVLSRAIASRPFPALCIAFRIPLCQPTPRHCRAVPSLATPLSRNVCRRLALLLVPPRSRPRRCVPISTGPHRATPSRDSLRPPELRSARPLRRSATRTKIDPAWPALCLVAPRPTNPPPSYAHPAGPPHGPPRRPVAFHTTEEESLCS